MLFKDISYLELWWPFCLVEGNHEEQLDEIILNLDHWFRPFCSAEPNH